MKTNFFDLGPKRSEDNFFNFAEELAAFDRALDAGAKLILIKGLRRTGKTTLMLTGLGRRKRPYLAIDVRSLTHGLTITLRDITRAFSEEQQTFLRRDESWLPPFRSAMKNLPGVVMDADNRATLVWGPSRRNSVDLTMFFEALGKLAESEHERIVIAIDEAQELKKLIDYDFRNLLAHTYDYVPGLQLVLTGSEIGLLDDLVGAHDVSSPLYGRANVVIQTRPLDDAQALRFLQEGFLQGDVQVSTELVEAAVKRFGGIIGWLTLFGHEASHAGRTDLVMQQVIQKASQIAWQDFEDFLRIRPGQARARYLTLISRVAQTGTCHWAELKRAVQESEGSKLPDASLANLLRNLVKASFLEMTSERTYRIPDPMVAEAMRSTNKGGLSH